MEAFTVGSFAVIVAICYMIGAILKQTPSEKINKFIPIIMGLCGAGLGILAFYVVPEFPADNILSALAIGISSGFASTGVNQIVKQASSGDKEGGEG